MNKQLPNHLEDDPYRRGGMRLIISSQNVIAMKNMITKKTCLGITAVVSVIGIIGVIIAAILVVLVIAFFIILLDDVTGPGPEVQPTGVAFFESTGGWDYARIALIEPYQAVSFNHNKTWTLNIRATGPSIRYHSLRDVSELKLDVIDKRYLVAYGTNTWLEGELVDEVWFVVIPEENIEKGFTSEEEFLAYLEDRGIGPPNLTDINELFRELGDKGYLEWFPETYK